MPTYKLGYKPYFDGNVLRWEFAESDGYVNGARDSIGNALLSKAGTGTLTRIDGTGEPAEYAISFPGGSGGPYLTGSIPVSGDFTIVVVAKTSISAEIVGPAATGSVEFYIGSNGTLTSTLRDPVSGNDVTATCAFGSAFTDFYFMAARFDQANKRFSLAAKKSYGSGLTKGDGVNGAGPWENSFSSITVSCAYYGFDLTYACAIDTLRVYNRLLADSELAALSDVELY